MSKILVFIGGFLLGFLVTIAIVLLVDTLEDE